MKVSKLHPHKPIRKYILTYTLGGISDKVKFYLEKLTKENDFQIVNLGDKKYKKFYNSGPAEFIDLINDAELLITDSFHGVAFSLILSTPFIVFEREDFTNKLSMNSRIDTILSMFNLEDRKIDNISYENSFKVNFDEVQLKLKAKQEEFNSYLDKGVKYFE